MANHLVARDLVARDAELTELMAAGADAGAVVIGDAGMGKTALASVVADRARATGDQVAWAVATAASRPTPFGAIAPLLPDDLVTLHPALVLGRVAKRLRPPEARRPPLVVVDDAHLLDDQSAAVVLGLASTEAARIVATVRTGATPPDAVVALWKDGYVPAIELGPLDRQGTHLLLQRCLGGEVAAATAELLWQRTRGNPLYLGELARCGRAEGRLRDDDGVWLWHGDLDVPARLADLLDRRFAGLSEGGLDALGALVLGEPLPFELLAAIASADAIGEVEARDLVEVTERDGAVRFGFVHPLLAAAAERHITASRRRRLADALARAAGTGGDLVQRARWELIAGGGRDAPLLVAGARAVLLHQPALAVRMAECALARQPTTEAALLLADGHAESGDPAAARAAIERAGALATTEDEAVAVELGEAAFMAWSERQPLAALALLRDRRSSHPSSYLAEFDSAAALITLFAGRPAAALATAEEVLAGAPSPRCAFRAATARTGALAMLDRPHEALDAAEALMATASTLVLNPYALGMAHAMAALAHHLARGVAYRPRTDPVSARWPLPGAAEEDGVVVWPLIEGAWRLFQGDLPAALTNLREAVAQQRAGEGQFRSEALAMLIVALAASGQAHDAAALLSREPPDELGVFPGLRAWAMSAVEAATGGGRAAQLALEAAEQADEGGAMVPAVAYLAEAARHGAAERAAERLAAFDRDPRSPVTAARAIAIRARASGDGRALLEAAEVYVAASLFGPALELAQLAVAALSRDASGARARATALVEDLRRRLRLGAPATAVSPLTKRELEIARLAARGTSDRDIATVLVLSVRTVESHLASVYRKLAITSRRQLREVVPPA